MHLARAGNYARRAFSYVGDALPLQVDTHVRIVIDRVALCVPTTDRE